MTSFAFSSVYLEIRIIHMNIYSKDILGIINIYSKNYHYEVIYVLCKEQRLKLIMQSTAKPYHP
jgi:hypothetical protein